MVARIGEEFTLKRLQIIQNRKIFLKPENPKYTVIEVTSRDDFKVWGVVTWVLHKRLEEFNSGKMRLSWPCVLPEGVH